MNRSPHCQAPIPMVESLMSVFPRVSVSSVIEESCEKGWWPRVYLGSENQDLTDFFPFHAIGFQCNPFRALTDEEWAAVAVLPADLQEALARGFDHLQI